MNTPGLSSSRKPFATRLGFQIGVGKKGPFDFEDDKKLALVSAASKPRSTLYSNGTTSRRESFEEEIPMPEGRAPSLTPEEAKEALRDLLDGGIGNGNVPTDDSDAYVPGLRKEVTLMPHQVQARVWMRGREDLAKKRAGGILADDMGLGKTIQVIMRILDRPLSKAEAENGWKKPTLVVCPVSVLQQWEDEIKKTTTGLKIMLYHGSKRDQLAHRLVDVNVVLTTYGIVCSEHATVTPDDPNSGTILFTTRWLRIILDEAHTIKNRKTKSAEGCFDLKAKFRWCLTATPMQNSVEDFYSLFRFLRLKPVNDWECYNSQIAKPLSKGPGGGLAMKRLQVVLHHVMLRRVKSQLACLKLPPRTVEVISCRFDASEKAFYAALSACAHSLIERIQAKKSLHGGKKYMNILVLLLRLRQACNHPCLVLEGYEEALKDDGLSTEDMLDVRDLDHDIFPHIDSEEHSDKKCTICLVRLTRLNVATKDWRNHCINCAALKVQAGNLRSPMRQSAKIREILRILKHVAKSSGGKEKTVIFSQFTSMLDVLEPFLVAIGVESVRYDGKMTPQERTDVLREIKKNVRKTVILVSLKAGGVGLNLTACNHVILVDMWWNPAVEEQACDRTHRVGQTRDVHIYKLKTDNTVEDRILELQERKRELAQTVLSGNMIKNEKLGMAELLDLFK